jgi:hypothetical protein
VRKAGKGPRGDAHGRLDKQAARFVPGEGYGWG